MRIYPLLLLLCLALLAPLPAWAQEDCWDLDCEENQPEPCDPWHDENCWTGNCGCRDCSINLETFLFYCECTGGDGWATCFLSTDRTQCTKDDPCYFV